MYQPAFCNTTRQLAVIVALKQFEGIGNNL